MRGQVWVCQSLVKWFKRTMAESALSASRKRGRNFIAICRLLENDSVADRLGLEVVASFACRVEKSIEEFLLNEGEGFRETM